MSSLGVGLITAFLFGFILWCLRFLCLITTYVLVGTGIYTRRVGRVFGEIGIGVFEVVVTLALTVFLYYVNHGVLRWFLCIAAFASVWLSVRVLERHFMPFCARVADRVRHAVIKVILICYHPLKRLVCMGWCVLLRMARKMTLPIRRKCAKIKASMYDRKRRRRMEQMLVKELISVTYGTKKA